MDAPLSADADAQSPFPASSKNSALKKGEGGTAEIEQNITKTLMLLIQTPPLPSSRTINCCLECEKKMFLQRKMNNALRIFLKMNFTAFGLRFRFENAPLRCYISFLPHLSRNRRSRPRCKAPKGRKPSNLSVRAIPSSSSSHCSFAEEKNLEVPLFSSDGLGDGG